MNRIKIQLTESQVKLLEPLRDLQMADQDGLFGSGMLIAQVFLFSNNTGGAVVGYADQKTSDQFQELMGTPKGKLLSRDDVSKIRDYFESL